MENATKLLWIEYWASVVDSNYKYAVIQDKKQKDGSWLVKAKVPYYDKIVSRQSNNLMDAILAVSDEVCAIIDMLMANNPNLYVENKYIDGHWKIVVDADGEGFTIDQSDEYYKETQNIQQNLLGVLSLRSEEILKTITKWIGSTKLVYFHIFDKRLFGSDNKEIINNTNILISKLHKGHMDNTRTFISGDSVISFGFKMKIE